MKRCLLIIASLWSLSTFAQSFDKGKIIGGMNYDFGVYATKVHDKRTDTTESDGAGNHQFSLWGEYGVLPWLGAGAKFVYASYITEADSATGIKPTASSFDFCLMVNAHLVRKEKFDLPLGVTFGGSTWKFKNNDKSNGYAKDFGTVLCIYTNPRFYFGEKRRFGFNFKLGYAMLNYPSVDFYNDNDSEINAASLKGGGVNIGAGFQASF